MLDIDIPGLDAFCANLDAQIARATLGLSNDFADATREIFKSMAELAPQWSGNLVANMNYSIGEPDYTYVKTDEKAKAQTQFATFSAKQRGDLAAVSQAIGKMENKPRPNLFDTVYVTFAAPADEGGYLSDVLQNNQGRVRVVNLVQGNVALIDYAENFLSKKYGG